MEITITITMKLSSKLCRFPSIHFFSSGHHTSYLCSAFPTSGLFILHLLGLVPFYIGFKTLKHNNMNHLSVIKPNQTTHSIPFTLSPPSPPFFFPASSEFSPISRSYHPLPFPREFRTEAEEAPLRRCSSRPTRSPCPAGGGLSPNKIAKRRIENQGNRTPSRVSGRGSIPHPGLTSPDLA